MARLPSLGAKRSAARATEAPDASALELHVGARLRHARLLNRMRLKDLAERAKCSESMLSKIENDRAVPSLTTLHRLCRTLNLSISALLNKDLIEPWTILRRGERAIIGHASGTGSEGVKAEVLIPSADGRLLEGFIVVIEPGGHTAGILQHKGEEVGYIIEGQLELTLGDEVHLLNAGDSFYFPSDLPHAYRNPGKTLMRAVWINTPPTF